MISLAGILIQMPMKTCFLSMLCGMCLLTSAHSAPCSFSNWWGESEEDEWWLELDELQAEKVSTKALEFVLTDAHGGAYDMTLDVDGSEAESPSAYQLQRYTVYHCNDAVDAGVWGIITDTESGVAMAAAHSGAITLNNPIVFDFEGAAVTLMANKSYTLTFVSGDVDAELKVGTRYLNAESEPEEAVALMIYATPVWYDEEAGEEFYYSGDSELRYSSAKTQGGEDSKTAPAVCIEAESVAVPEPTSAMLSLLALAGLVARRRRH